MHRNAESSLLLGRLETVPAPVADESQYNIITPGDHLGRPGQRYFGEVCGPKKLNKQDINKLEQ